jgi:hypothetical protein
MACTLGSLCFFAENKDFFSAIGPLLVSVTALIGLGSFFFAIWQYRRTQVWKRNEFLASEMEKFFRDEDVIDVEGMLDYTGRTFICGDGDSRLKITTYHSDESGLQDKPPEFFVDLNVALRYHEEGGQSEADIIIREKFDAYFSYIQRFATFVRIGYSQKPRYFLI